jgi:hypothetical protein
MWTMRLQAFDVLWMDDEHVDRVGHGGVLNEGTKSVLVHITHLMSSKSTMLSSDV